MGLRFMSSPRSREFSVLGSPSEGGWICAAHPADFFVFRLGPLRVRMTGFPSGTVFVEEAGDESGQHRTSPKV
jgi:hypothetical protein